MGRRKDKSDCSSTTKINTDNVRGLIGTVNRIAPASSFINLSFDATFEGMITDRTQEKAAGIIRRHLNNLNIPGVKRYIVDFNTRNTRMPKEVGKRVHVNLEVNVYQDLNGFIEPWVDFSLTSEYLLYEIEAECLRSSIFTLQGKKKSKKKNNLK